MIAAGIPNVLLIITAVISLTIGSAFAVTEGIITIIAIETYNK